MKKVYLDYNATTPTAEEVVAAMQPFYNKIFGNPQSIHLFGQEARKEIEAARSIIASFIAANSSEEIIFTSSGTEANNLAIKGVTEVLKNKGNHIVTSKIEHHSVLNTCKYLEKQGFKVTYLPVDEYGVINPEDVRKAITKDTILVSIMHVNNETGVIQPIEEIGRILQEINELRETKNEPRIYFHTDAVQSVGKIKVNVQELNVDLLSISAHKIYGPKGIGSLFIRKGILIEPILHGGEHERNRRAGTENTPAIVGFAKAVTITEREMEKEAKRLSILREKLYKGIKNKIAHTHLNTHLENSVPNTLNIAFEYTEGESVILSLDMKGIAVSAGAACASGAIEPSHVIRAMNKRIDLVNASVRFSLGRYTKEEDIDYVIEVLPDIIKHLRELSPLYKNKRIT